MLETTKIEGDKLNWREMACIYIPTFKAEMADRLKWLA